MHNLGESREVLYVRRLDIHLACCLVEGFVQSTYRLKYLDYSPIVDLVRLGENVRRDFYLRKSLDSNAEELVTRIVDNSV